MTTDVITTATDAQAAPTPYELNNMSTQALRGELARSLTMTARHLAYLAAIWAELEHRGEDLSDLRTGLAVYLPQIAAGQLDAEAVIRFAGSPTVLRNVALLPVAEQHAIATGRPVQVLTIDASGGYTSAEMPAYTLTAAQARLVFDAGKIRSPAEQRAILESAKVSAQRRKRPGDGSRVRYDSKTDLLRVGNARATVGEVLSALTQDVEAAEAADLTNALMIRLTETEHRMVKVRAAEAGQSLQEFVRRLLISKARL